jgi:hypothetical protein
MDRRQFADVQGYAWSWSAATFLDGHPRWQSRFRQLIEQIGEPDAQFTGPLWRDLRAAPEPIEEAWQLFLNQLDYGYDVAADVIDFQPERPWQNRAAVLVDARRGWQSTGLRLESGRGYRLRAEGRYRLTATDPVWWSEPGGVTIQYVHGRPRGMLLAAVRRDTGGESPVDYDLLHPEPVGLATELRPDHGGLLFLRINEPAGQRGDNEGSVNLKIEAIEPD